MWVTCLWGLCRPRNPQPPHARPTFRHSTTSTRVCCRCPCKPQPTGPATHDTTWTGAAGDRHMVWGNAMSRASLSCSGAQAGWHCIIATSAAARALIPALCDPRLRDAVSFNARTSSSSCCNRAASTKTFRPIGNCSGACPPGVPGFNSCTRCFQVNRFALLGVSRAPQVARPVSHASQGTLPPRARGAWPCGASVVQDLLLLAGEELARGLCLYASASVPHFCVGGRPGHPTCVWKRTRPGAV
jgi:hypothetical protein